MKKYTKYFLRLLVGIFIPIISYLLIGLVLSLISTNPDKIECTEKREIYIASNGIHLDIIIPKRWMKYNLVQELGIPHQANFVSFGWGDKGFYLETPTWDQLTFRVAAKAIFFKSETAMHVDYNLRKSNSWNALMICEKQCDELIEFVMSSFRRNENGQLIPIDAPGYFETDRFYEAYGSYTVINTCNHWVNIGLKQSQVKTSIWSPFDYGVLYHVKGASSKM